MEAVSTSPHLQTLRQEIAELKREKNALILAHFYEEGDIQDVADQIGDSLFLAQQGEKATNPIILLIFLQIPVQEAQLQSE